MSWWRGDSLRLRLLKAAAVWLVVSLTAVGVVLTFTFRDSIERSHTLRLAAVLRALVGVIEIKANGLPEVTHPLGDPRFDQIYGGWYWQISSDNGPLVRSRSLWDSSLPLLDHQTTPTLNPPPDASVVSQAPYYIATVPGPDGKPVILIERELTFPGGTEPFHLSVAASLHDVVREVKAFHQVLITTFVVLAGVLLLGLLAQISFGLRPLQTLTTNLERVQRHTGQRLQGHYPQEVKPLVAALNTVLDHDARLVAQARTHLGNLAHALKTPLAVLQAELSAPKRNDATMQQQIRQMAQIIERHLTRARVQSATVHNAANRTAVQTTAQDIARMLRKIHAERNLTLTVMCPSDVTFSGDYEELAEMLGNLMDNACKWARQQVQVTADSDNGVLTITVDDDGPGMTDEQCAAATRRGVRLDEGTPGSGLGLSIVSDLVAFYKGRLDLTTSPLGGLRARLIFDGSTTTPLGDDETTTNQKTP